MFVVITVDSYPQRTASGKAVVFTRSVQKKYQKLPLFVTFLNKKKSNFLRHLLSPS